MHDYYVQASKITSTSILCTYKSPLTINSHPAMYIRVRLWVESCSNEISQRVHMHSLNFSLSSFCVSSNNRYIEQIRDCLVYDRARRNIRVSSSRAVWCSALCALSRLVEPVQSTAWTASTGVSFSSADFCLPEKQRLSERRSKARAKRWLFRCSAGSADA